MESEPQEFEGPWSHLSNLFPGLNQDSSFQDLIHQDPEILSQHLPDIINKLPYQCQYHDEHMQKMRKYRELQERLIHNKIQEMRPIDFIDEVCKYNPEIGRAIQESENMPSALQRIIRESNQRVESFKMELKARCDAIFDEKQGNEYNPESWEYSSNRYESDTESLNFLDNKINSKRNLQNEMPLDLETDFRRGDEKDLRSPNQKSKKIVLFSTSKRYVFGFDKVENLMEPSLLDDELMPDSGRDILREINNINYENTHQNFKFMNFALN